MADDIVEPRRRGFKDITGETFGRLEALSPHHLGSDGWHWNVRCACGGPESEFVTSGASLRNGRTLSCKCLQKERAREAGKRNKRHGHSVGGVISPEYRAWQNMITRCHNPKASKYEYYGLRGITVCQEWRDSFDAFIKDMGPRPSPTHSIERDRVNEGYGPGNCRWATKVEQANNKRSNRMLTHDGKTMSLANWARELGIDRQTLKMRLKTGWSVEETLSQPVSHVSRSRRAAT